MDFKRLFSSVCSEEHEKRYKEKKEKLKKATECLKKFLNDNGPENKNTVDNELIKESVDPRELKKKEADGEEEMVFNQNYRLIMRRELNNGV